MKKGFLSPSRVGIVGLGFGASVHIPAFLSIKGVEIVGIAGKNLLKTREIADNYKIPMAFDNFEELFEQKLDAISLALPPKQNEIVCRKALEKNFAVLSEKPLASSAKIASKLAELAKNSTTMVNFQFAEVPIFKELKKIIESKKLGNVRHVQVVWLLESFAQRNRIWSWKTDARQCGGVITLLGSHFLYLADWLFGSVNRLFAKKSCKITSSFAPPDSVPADDLVCLILEHVSGVQVAATIGNASPGGSGHRWEVVFNEGTLVLYNSGPDYMSGFSLSIRTHDNEESILIKDEIKQSSDGRLSPFCAMARKFIESIKESQPVFPDFVVGARIQKLIEAVYFSADYSKYVEIKT